MHVWNNTLTQLPHSTECKTSTWNYARWKFWRN